MTAVTFPTNPSNGDTYLVNGRTYVYTSTTNTWSVPSTYSGIFNPIDSKSYVATSGQSTFSVTYTNGLVEAYVNGIKIDPAGYSATNGTSITFNTGLTAGDVVNLTGYSGSVGVTATTLSELSDVSTTAPTDRQVLAWNNSSSVWAPANTGIAIYATANDLPLSGNNTGDQAFVSATNRLYLWNGTGWYNIALINTNPSITGGYSSDYVFATDGTPIEITLVGSDPEGIPLTWSYEVTSGSLTNGGGTTATVSNVDNVFTITPSTNLYHSGAFSLTFKASDGINIATAISSFTLQFILLNSNHTTLLAKGTAATQNTTFIDSSTNNHTITANGDVYQGTFSPYRSGGYSLYLDGVDDNVTVPYNSTAFNMGTTTDFTMEAWINIPSYGKNILVVYPGSSTGNWLWLVDGSGYLSLYVYPSISYWTPTGATVPLNEWVHVALTRTGSTWQMYVNGVSAGTLNESQSFWSAGNTLYIGSRPTSGYANEYIGGIRIIKGTAIYSGNFTPPEDVFDVVAGTSLLVCNNKNRLYDESTYSHTVTPNNGASILPFSRFDYKRYDASTNGGSAYFDGTGDYLTAGNSLDIIGNDDWTIECWAYSAAGVVLVSNQDGGSDVNYISFTPTAFQFRDGSGQAYAYPPTTPNYNQWNHYAIVKNGTTFTFYLNGVGGTPSTISKTLTSRSLKIGAFLYTGFEGYFAGYMSTLRIVKGTAVYTSNFTPPTAPLTAITNTSLLLNFNNAGIQDYSQVSDLKLFGNTTGSNTQTKNASYSMYFDGTGDYIAQPTNEAYGYGTGDFTIEFWLYLNATGTQTLVSNLTSDTSTNPHIYVSTTIYYFTANANRITGPSLSTGQWYHIALCRASGATKLFVDGAQVGSTYSDSNDYGTTAPLGIGTYFNSGVPVTASTLNGYIEDLRITKGLARYTANFTPTTLELLG